MPVSKQWMERGRRVLGMDFNEIRVRARQEVAKRWDAALYRTRLLRMSDDRALKSPGPGRFFFDSQDVPAILAGLEEQIPKIIEEIVSRAEQICRHRFDLLGYQAVDYGAEIDWHLDAIHGKRAPRRPWFQVRFLDFNQVGDSKITWELSRHQHLVTLAKAYRITGEVRYGEELFQQWYHWQAQNPYPIGINWASSLEVAFRSLSWLWGWHLLKGSSVVPQRFPADLQSALMVNARHIERFLSTFFSPNTHLLGEGVGLFFIGTLCAELPRAEDWQRRGWQIILHEANRQIQPDGMHFEQSLYYHTYALDFFIHARILAELNGIPVPPAFDQTVESMLEVVCVLGKVGPLPRLGDDDGGRVFDPRRNRSEHLLDPLATGALLYNRPEFQEVAGGPREETMWLIGRHGTVRPHISSSQKQNVSSFALPASGIYVMATSGPAVQRCVIDAGPQGTGRAGHGHADALSLQIAVDGEELLIDPGTLVYADSAGERDRFRETTSHNTLAIDGLSQAEPSGPFGWRTLPDVRVERWVTGNTFDLLTASHNGYSRLSTPVRHRRYVFHLKPRFWLIRDVLEGTLEHHIELAWHFAPGSLWTDPEGVRFLGDKQHALALLFAPTQALACQIDGGWYSPVYGQKESCPILRLGGRTRLPMEIATMLLPLQEASTPTGQLRRFEAEYRGAAVRGYRYTSSSTVDYIFFADEAREWQIEGWSSDARFLFCSIAGAKTIQQLVLSEGTYIELNGRHLFKSNVPMGKAEWIGYGSDHGVPCLK